VTFSNHELYEAEKQSLIKKSLLKKSLLKKKSFCIGGSCIFLISKKITTILHEKK